MEQILEQIETLKTGLLKLEQLVKDTDKKRKRTAASSSGSKKQKLSLREEFIAANNPASVFDSLHGKLSEQQLRDIYKF
jgi:hypothetical protein